MAEPSRLSRASLRFVGSPLYGRSAGREVDGVPACPQEALLIGPRELTNSKLMVNGISRFLLTTGRTSG